MSQNYRNSDVHARTWNRLVDRARGCTLHLEPGESTKDGVGVWDEGAVTHLPPDFADPNLEPVRAPRKAATDGATDTPAAPAAEPKE